MTYCGNSWWVQNRVHWLQPASSCTHSPLPGRIVAELKRWCIGRTESCICWVHQPSSGIKFYCKLTYCEAEVCPAGEPQELFQLLLTQFWRGFLPQNAVIRRVTTTARIVGDVVQAASCLNWGWLGIFPGCYGMKCLATGFFLTICCEPSNNYSETFDVWWRNHVEP